jgi:hypothetical protein
MYPLPPGGLNLSLDGLVGEAGGEGLAAGDDAGLSRDQFFPHGIQRSVHA